MATANEGLAYLNSRKEFWQQEQPVYARRNKGQIISEQKCGYGRNPNNIFVAFLEN